MEPITPTAFRGPVPIPPQRGNKNTNAVNSGVNPPKSTTALPPNLNNSMSTNHTYTGILWIPFSKRYRWERCEKKVARSVSLWFPNKCLMLWDWLSGFSTLLLFKDPAQSLASDFGFEDNFNLALKVEEKKNHQNRIVASRGPPPVPPLPPRKNSYNASNSQPPPPVPKERVVSLHANSLTTSSKPESVNNWAQIFNFNEKTEITDLAFSQEIPKYYQSRMC